MGLIAAPVDAQSLPAAGDGVELWVVAPGEASESADAERQPGGEAGSLTVLHRRVGDAPDWLRRVAELRGRVAPGAAACADGRLWLVYDDLAVQSLTSGNVDRQKLPGDRYPPPSIRRRLPAGVKLLSLAANGDGPWALVRVDSADALRAIDQPQTPSATATATATAPPVDNAAAKSGGEDGGKSGGKSGGEDGGKSGGEPSPIEGEHSPTPPATPPGEPRPGPDAASVDQAYEPVDRLLRLERDRWQKVDLPPDWPLLARPWLVMGRADAAYPHLLTLPTADLVWVYTRQDDAWVRQAYAIAIDADLMQPLAVSGQLVVGHLQAGDSDLAVELSLLRAGEVLALGRLSIPGALGRPWSLVASGQTVALVVTGSTATESGAAGEAAPALLWTSMALSGHLVSPPTPLTLEPSMSPYSPGQILVGAVLAVSMLLMLTLWRRDPLLAKTPLPPGVVLAGLGRRVLAGIIDLAPCMAAAAAVFGVETDATIVNPSATSGHWVDLVPPLAAIGMNVVHTALTEMFTARTLGKAICRIRVVTLAGDAPDVWQALTRNLMRSFDLIAWYVLPILVVLGPYRQRLGDMAARTIVVADTPAESIEPE